MSAWVAECRSLQWKGNGERKRDASQHVKCHSGKVEKSGVLNAMALRDVGNLVGEHGGEHWVVVREEVEESSVDKDFFAGKGKRVEEGLSIVNTCVG